MPVSPPRVRSVGEEGVVSHERAWAIPDSDTTLAFWGGGVKLDVERFQPL